MTVIGMIAVAGAIAGSSGSDMVQFVAHATDPYRGPVAYSDKKLQRLFYVESDGQHLSCISFDGKVMWTRVPFVDARLKPYRMERPRIVSIGQPLPWMLDKTKGTFVLINFESTQFGIVDVDSGGFRLGVVLVGGTVLCCGVDPGGHLASAQSCTAGERHSDGHQAHLASRNSWRSDAAICPRRAKTCWAAGRSRRLNLD